MAQDDNVVGLPDAIFDMVVQQCLGTKAKSFEDGNRNRQLGTDVAILVHVADATVSDVEGAAEATNLSCLSSCF
jgi:hypothetical protein